MYYTADPWTQGLGMPTFHTTENLCITLQQALHSHSSACVDSNNCRSCSTVVQIYWKNMYVSSNPCFSKVNCIICQLHKFSYITKHVNPLCTHEYQWIPSGSIWFKEKKHLLTFWFFYLSAYLYLYFSCPSQLSPIFSHHQKTNLTETNQFFSLFGL